MIDPKIQVEKIAATYGCTVREFAHDVRHDEYSVILKCGNRYGALRFDGRMASYEGLLRREVTDLASRTRAASWLDGVPVAEIGAECPTHAATLTMVDFDAWRCRCTNEEHDLPEKVATYSRSAGQYLIRTRDA